MENKNEQALSLLHLRFIGKILAGFTHEIKNYIAIIKESVGLMEDMIRLGKLSKNDSGQYLEIISSIGEQIEKTTSLFGFLNRFSHRMDTSVSTFNVNESLEELSALINRFANQRKISIGKEFHEDLPPIQSNPSMLQFVVFSVLEDKMTQLDKNSRISIRTERINGAIAIRITTEGNILESEKNKGKLSYELCDTIIKQLGGEISQGTREDIIIIIPEKSS